MRRDIEQNPRKYLSNTPGGVQASTSHYLIPTKKLLFFFSTWDVVCLCIHWVVQNTKQHPSLLHAGSVYTIRVGSKNA